MAYDSTLINPKALQPVKRYVDIVFCLALTSSMEKYLPTIKHAIKVFYKYISEKADYTHPVPDELRVRIIGFNSTELSAQSSLVESEFFAIPRHINEFNLFLDELKTASTDGFKNNALHAIAMAMKSNWHKYKDADLEKNRHIIVVISDSASISLEETNNKNSYKENLPKNYDEMLLAWLSQVENYTHLYPYAMDQIAERLVIFAPEDAYPWSDMAEEFDYAAVAPFSMDMFLGDDSNFNELIRIVCNFK